MTTIFKCSWGPILFECYHNMCTTFYGKYWYKYLCNICLKLQRAVAAKNHMCLKILIRISWEYLFENINMNILGIFVWKYQYEYLGNICLKILIRISWEYLFETKLQRAMAAEAEAAREARAKAIQVICFSLKVFSFSSVSPSRFFFFFLLVFVLLFFLYLLPHHL